MSEKEKEMKENKVTKTAEVKKEEKTPKSVKEEKARETKETENKKEDKKVETKPVDTKKTENKKEEKKKFEVKTNQTKKTTNKKAPWAATVITVLAVLVVVALLTYMIVTSSDPKKTVDGFLTNLKAGDFAKAQEFVSGSEELLSDEDFDDETKALLFDKLSWKVTKVTKEENEATVEIEVTNKDFDTIISNCMKKLLEDFKVILNGGSVEQNMDKYFTEELKNEQVETTTVTKTIQLVKEDKTWKVVSNDELIDALLPGLQEAINEVN
ncbi:MAG: hypothetical protein ACI4VH_04655 [Clostridia bacterium]